jgi:hypothetical protein
MDHLNGYYKRLAVESYSGKAPLILSTSEWLHQGSAFAPRPINFEITVVYRSVWLSIYYYEPTRLNSFLKEMPSRKIGQGLQALPLLMQTAKPRFIVLSQRFPYQRNHAEKVAALARVLEVLAVHSITLRENGNKGERFSERSGHAHHDDHRSHEKRVQRSRHAFDIFGLSISQNHRIDADMKARHEQSGYERDR